MKFKEYMKIRKSICLTKKETDLFGIDLSKGWLKRYADLDLSEELVIQAAVAVCSDPKQKYSMATKRLGRLIIPKVKVDGEKFLYLLENATGNQKIGISVDPKSRCKGIATASGVSTSLLAYWKLPDALKYEAMILKKFKSKALLGEWFKPETLSISLVEEVLSQHGEVFERLYTQTEIVRKELQKVFVS